MVQVQVLGSGSTGNALVLSCGRRRVLVDIGISYKDLLRRMAAAAVDPATVEAIFLTHEHEDHVKGLRIFLKHFPVPVFAAPATFEASTLHAVPIGAKEPLHPGQTVTVGGVCVTPFLVPHDAVTYGYVYECEGVRVGHATDLGVPLAPVAEHLEGCHCLLVEFNHDVDKLASGSYPAHLKLRIRGELGHLSNEQGAQLLSRAAGPETRAVYLMHLSRSNNEPLLARAAALGALGHRPVRLEVALPHEVSAPWTA